MTRTLLAACFAVFALVTMPAAQGDLEAAQEAVREFKRYFQVSPSSLA